jgi:hypothetical protein
MPTCLDVSFALLDDATSSFGVRLSCIEKNGSYVDRQLYRISHTLLSNDSIQLSDLRLDIDETASQFSQCAIVLEVLTQGYDKLVAINNVQQRTGKCQLTFGKDSG